MEATTTMGPDEIRSIVRQELLIASAEWLTKENAILLLQGTKYTLAELRKNGLSRKMVGRRSFFSRTEINQAIANM
ncbi:hypothetical protein [Lacticaseibacillus mingshuiensis]|uniref:hypothetical protein n=1 Tax=Lacticaseibacillus mingshuiensis TaxID=2799574 RepID=UPI00194EF17F|nr:hypothetical protein [Lacticaseibacillus mingshuiensis]